ncbi:MAG: taurine dioxygenase [Gammaproteobacteria bacterium]|nr:taurine dioxygenase [Gammaproteobacteria bacterium]
MNNNSIEITPLSPAIGAEIRGVDLREPLSNRQFDEIHNAFAEHQVLFFRGQEELAPEAQVRFGRMFGDLHTHPAAPTHPDHPEIFVIHAHRDSKIANGNFWHTDVSCDEEPPLGTALQLHLLPSNGGDTLFASMYAAYEALSDLMKRILSSLTAMHESEHLYRGRYSDRGVDDASMEYPSAEHPVIRTHPVTGKQAIYVNSCFTTRIVGLERKESDALLEFLFQHCQRPEFQIRWRWQKNDMVFWDNRCVQHFAVWDYWPEERRGHRVTIQGEKPFHKA